MTYVTAAGKNTDIEVLRGFAIISALISHMIILSGKPLPGMQWLQSHLGFWGGVDLFFTISGFMITQSLLRAQRLRNAMPLRDTLKVFWIKRAYRLFPSAWLWIALPLLAGALMPGTLPANLWSYAAAAALNIANIGSPFFLHSEGAAYLHHNPFAHYWTLSMEEQFYVVFPILLLLTPPRLLIAALVVGIVLQFGWGRDMFTLAWYTRTDALMWGVMLGLTFQSGIYQRLNPVLLQKRWIGAPVFYGLLLLLGLVTYRLGSFDFAVGLTPRPIAVGVIALVCAALVFVASFDRHYLMLPGWPKAMLVWLGERSYSIYLIHHSLFMLVAAIYLRAYVTSVSSQEPPMFFAVVVGVVLTLVLAELNYRYVEVPMRDYGRKLARRW